jgi:hypothetical protein
MIDTARSSAWRFPGEKAGPFSDPHPNRSVRFGVVFVDIFNLKVVRQVEFFQSGPD